jgi:hypothetical protein
MQSRRTLRQISKFETARDVTCDAETKRLRIYVCDVDSTGDGYTTVSDKYTKETVIKKRL